MYSERSSFMSSEHYEVEIKDKMTLSIEEAAAYSGIGINKLRELTKSPFCDFVLYVGKKTLIKRVPFEEYINRATEV